MSEPSERGPTTMERLESAGAALRGGDRLDDVTRARMWGRIEARLAAPATVPTAARRRVLVGGAAALAAAAAIATLIVRRSGTDEGELRVAADSTLATKLGGYTRASIVGPAVVAVTAQRGDATIVALRSGTLVAEFAGGPGRTLRIEAPRMTVDIVGTVFAIEVGPDRTCVSVAHGRVRARAGAREISVGGGEHACSDDAAATRSIEPHVQELLQRQDAPSPTTIAATTTPDSTSTGSIGSISATMPSEPAATAKADVAKADGAKADVAKADVAKAGRAIADVARTDIASTDPARAGVANAKVANVDVSNVDVAKAGRAIADVAKDGVAKADVAKAEVAKADIASTDVAKAGVAKAEVAKTEVAKDGVERDGVAKAEVAKAEVAKAEGAKAEVAKAEGAQPTAEQRYEAAEAALRRHDTAAADRILAELVARAPSSALVDQAIFERARIAYQRHAWAEARARLAELAALAATPLAESGRFLACRVAVDSHDGDATRCLAEFRAAYHHSSHDLDALAMLATLAPDCAGARPFVDELAVRYPHASETRRAQDRCR